MKLSEHVLLSVEERRKHLDLSTPCELIPNRRNYKRRLQKLFEHLGIEADIPLRGNNLRLTNLCKSGDTDGLCLCTNPKHIWVTQLNERSEEASRLWLSLSDGFVSHSGGVVIHNRAVGAPEDNRVQLTHEEHATLHTLYEEVEGKTLKGNRWWGKRLPPEHWPERVKAYLKEKGAT
jgi:hypothetical protein